MGFLKNLFSKNKPTENNNVQLKENEVQAIYSTNYFNERYEEDDIYKNEIVLDGCLKMVESYFLDNKLECKNKEIVNHPENLDQLVNEGFGFSLYCKTFDFEDSQTILFLAYAFSDYLIKKYGFKMYKDNTPDSPMRSMTLKYDKNGAVLSLYPFEFSLKVLENDASFVELAAKLENSLGNMPNVEEVLKNI